MVCTDEMNQMVCPKTTQSVLEIGDYHIPVNTSGTVLVAQWRLFPAGNKDCTHRRIRIRMLTCVNRSHGHGLLFWKGRQHSLYARDQRDATAFGRGTSRVKERRSGTSSALQRELVRGNISREPRGTILEVPPGCDPV